MRLLAALLFSFSVLYVGGAATAGGPSCGCEGYRGHHHCRLHSLFQLHGSCCHHASCCQCCKEPTPRSREVEQPLPRPAPSGPIVESYPMMRAMPMMAAMPMMIAGSQVRGATYARRTRAPEKDCCIELEERMEALDERVDALDRRMETIQRAVEIQTRILEELKAQGTIGNKPVKTTPAAECK